jgi:hypothetical protein
MELSGARVTVVTVEMELFAKVYKCYSFLKLKFEDNLEIGFSPPRQAVTKIFRHLNWIRLGTNPCLLDSSMNWAAA